MSATAAGEDAAEVFGSDEQQAILQRSRIFFDLTRGDSRFSYHGRAVGLVSPQTGSVEDLAALGSLLGNSHFACIPPADIDRIVEDTKRAGLVPTLYRRWESGPDTLQVARDVVRDTVLPAEVRLHRMTPETPAALRAGFAKMALGCGVLPAVMSAHCGTLFPARTLLAVTDDGAVVSAAVAVAYLHDGSDLGRQEAFWGMLATDPAWRGHRLSLLLGAQVMLDMQQAFGFTTFYTGVEDGNAASEAVCARVGLEPRGNAILTAADPRQLRGGRMTK